MSTPKTDSAAEIWIELETLVAAGDSRAIRALLDGLSDADRVHATSHLDAEVLADVLEALRREDAAELLDWLPEVQAADALDEVEPAAAAEMLEQMPSDDRVDLLARMDDVEAVLAESDPEAVAEARELLSYPPDTAGGLMATEVFSVPEHLDVGEAVGRIRRDPQFAQSPIQYVYVVDGAGALVGLVQLRTLVISQSEQRIADLMVAKPIAVGPAAGVEELEELFDHYAFLGIPVVDDGGEILGVVERSALDEMLAETAQSDHMKSLGLTQEELRSMPLLTRSGRRLSWLSVNVVLNIAAASVIAAYQDTLEAAIALAVFLPMISDMSGCSGNQAVAVSMRELSLGILRPAEALRVWRKELSLGVLNGLALGSLIGLVAFLWKGSVALGAVVGGALAVNTVVAVSIGGVIPLLLRRLGHDPALASGPILTTVTDMCGFFFALSFATLVLDQL